MATDPSIPRRPLGKTGFEATLFGLGGEGVLRTFGRAQEAIPVIQRALDLGVNYFDTAPAYSGSRDYYGAALGERRKGIFLASKTHDRTRDGSMRLLEDSLKRLRTDHLDLWQLHDLRTKRDLDEIFGRNGALEALVEARRQGLTRFLGITGHHDPAILLDAMGRFDFDSVLVALNSADLHRLPFITTVLPEAARRGMAVIAMKVYCAGELLAPGGLTAEEALSYALTLPGVSTAIIGCRTPEEVEENVRIARRFRPRPEKQMRGLEIRSAPRAEEVTDYKRPDRTRSAG